LVRQTIVSNSESSYVLADATKFERVARHRVTGWSTLSGLITDQAPPESIRTSIAEAGGRILIS
jgi:DeoR family fructose operon transcriptional repressor